MKIWTLLAAFLAIFTTAHAQLDTTGPRTATEAATEEEPELTEAQLKALTDSINASFTYKTGKVILGNGVVLEVPAGFRYLDVPQSHRVLEEIWGNPKNETLGMLFPADRGPMDESGWAFNIDFEDIGFVKDEDADKIDYDDMLKQLKKETAEANPDRIKEGYPSVEFIGWAAAPFYDKANKTLHWAKEIKFGESEEHTLNYNVRILGRKGVLSMNAIGVMNQLPEIKQHIPAILKSTTFEAGHAYADFDPKVDEVAAWTIGGLVAGKVLAKVGFFAIIAKFGKFIVMGLIGVGAAAYKYITGRRRKEEEVQPEPAPVAAAGGEPEDEPKA
ncbi:DUF2167 domain-containing protein [Chitinophaga lutea]|uniref:DUF2167 domain-containing protein n=1 Tax=Chitinophaga lutea TaxID=2488634 RepID=A0A3N4QBE5_9BACT|nr:DUF2167 domain-containing protein [Chitinophaga lutea]RPE09074.1 DUF2167 domain-containing protein [Chitinophaga lutea]